MKVTAPAAFSFVTPLGRGVDAGETVEVDDELGAQLVEQGWTPSKATRTARNERARQAEDLVSLVPEISDTPPEDGPPIADPNATPAASQEV